MANAFSGSLEAVGKIIGAIIVIVGPPIALYTYLPSHGTSLEITYQSIVDYAFFVAIIFILHLLIKIDKEKADKPK